MLHVTLFLAERGLAFRGSSCRLDDPNNGNFLGILELLSCYDSVLKQHLDKVCESQKSGKRFQVNYLSNIIQNEFISICGQHVTDKILQEQKESNYYAIIVDGTPDTSHKEQTTIILRLVLMSTSILLRNDFFRSVIAVRLLVMFYQP